MRYHLQFARQTVTRSQGQQRARTWVAQRGQAQGRVGVVGQQQPAECDAFECAGMMQRTSGCSS